MSRAWLFLIVAGLLEVAWAVGLKQSNGFTRPLPVAVVLVTAPLSFYLLALGMRALPVGTAYAVWTGIGAVGAAIIGIVFLGESRNLWRLLSLLLIIIGIAGLRLTSRG